MKFLIFVIFNAFPTIILAEPGVQVSHLGSNALVFTVSQKGFTTNEDFVTLESNKVRIKRSSKVRAGCAIKTPWIKTINSRISLEVFPKMKVDWAGNLGPQSTSEEDLLEIRVYTRRHAKDNNASQTRYYMQTGDLELKWIREAHGEDTYYRGSHSNYYKNIEQALSSDSILSFGSAEITNHGEFQVALCNIQYGTSIDLESIAVIAELRRI